MIVLTETTDNLQIVLGGAITTNQLRCVSSWRDITTTAYTPGRTVTNTNNTTDVNVVPAPASSTQRVVDFLSVHNADTVAATVTVKFDANGTEYIIWSGELLPGSTLQYVDGGGFAVVGDAYQPIKEVQLHGDAGVNFAMTNATLAERFAGNSTRHIVVANLKGYTQGRFFAQIQVASASASTPKIRLRYYTSWNGTFSNYLQLGASGHADISVFTGTAATLGDTGWFDLAAGAKADGIALAMCEIGGDAAADPAVGWTAAWFR